MDSADGEQGVICGMPDTRGIPLDRLAADGAERAAENLRYVLPQDGSGRLTVARFGSSI